MGQVCYPCWKWKSSKEKSNDLRPTPNRMCDKPTADGYQRSQRCQVVSKTENHTTVNGRSQCNAAGFCNLTFAQQLSGNISRRITPVKSRCCDPTSPPDVPPRSVNSTEITGSRFSKGLPTNMRNFKPILVSGPLSFWLATPSNILDKMSSSRRFPKHLGGANTEPAVANCGSVRQTLTIWLNESESRHCALCLRGATNQQSEAVGCPTDKRDDYRSPKKRTALLL